MERPIRKHYLDEKPQKENTLLESSDESILDYCEGLDMEPILKSMFKNYKLEILLQNLWYNKILFFSRISFLFKFSRMIYYDVWTIRGISLKIEVTKTVKIMLVSWIFQKKFIYALHMHKTLLKRDFIKEWNKRNLKVFLL